MSFLENPWPWYVAGPLIAAVMFLMLYFGKSFGLSSNLRTICSAFGAGKNCEFFHFDWRGYRWNLVFVLGAIIGGLLAGLFLTPTEQLALNTDTVTALQQLGFADAGEQYLPNRIFGAEALQSVAGWSILLGGGFLVGFGARYAGGCTSGHAVSGLSNLQLPSLLAVIGFFVGGLIMTHFLIPVLFA